MGKDNKIINNKNLLKCLTLVFVFFLLIFFYFNPSPVILSLLGIGLVVLVSIVWGIEGGIIVLFLLSSIVFSVFFKSPEMLLFGVSVAAITMAMAIRLKALIRELEKSKEQYQLIVNNISGATYSRRAKDQKGLVFLNPYFKKITGYLLEPFLTGEKKLSDIIHPEDWARVNKEIDKKIKTKGTWDLEYRIITSDEKNKWVNEKGKTTLNKDGTFLIDGIIFDINDKKIIEESLRESEEKYRNLVERANDGIVIVQKGKIKYANSKIINMLGQTKEEIIETNFGEYLLKEERAKFLEKRQEAEIKGTSLVYETVLENKKSDNIYIEINLGFINYQGKLADLIIIRDISQRKQIEEIIRQRDQEFRNLVERAPDLIARFDNEFRCLYINPIVGKDLGFQPRDLFWKTPREMGNDEKAAQIWESGLKSVFMTQKEKAIYTKNSKRYYYTRLLPEFDKKGEVKTILAISRDVTEMRNIDKIKSEFISISSHQIRTPLSVIRWCTMMFLDGMLGEITQKQKNYLHKIHDASKAIIKISNTFLNVAILELGILNLIPKEINLIEITQEVIEELKGEKEEKKIMIYESYSKDLPIIKADEKILKIVLKGLLANAIKYGHPEGNIWLKIEKQEEEALIEIADDGLGIPAEEQFKVFTKFFRAGNVKDKEIYGTGLDLYIIKEIVTNFEGRLWFQSPNPALKERGTVFYFTIPLGGMKKKRGKKGLN